MNYYLGIDIGTTASKAVAFSGSGSVLASLAIEYPMQHPQPGWSEQNPDEIFEAVTKGISGVIKTLVPAYPLLISFSAAMHSLIAVDENGKLLSQCIIWADNRADLVAGKLKKTTDGSYCYHTSGVPIHAMSPLCKLLWFKENDPQLFNTAFKFIGIKEYIFYKLFDDFIIDTSIASATGLLNNKTLDWDDKILAITGIKRSQLSRIVSTKEAFYNKGNYAGLPGSVAIPFVIGASDGALANLGTGASGNSMAITIGTSGAARMVITAPETDSQMRTFCYHLKDKDYIAGGASNNGAVVLQWLKENILETNEDYESLFDVAKTVAPGSEGLLLLPYILGERAPLWNSNAQGVFFGLTIHHTKAHLIRAAMEGVVYCMYSIGNILAEKRTITAIHASGGFAKNALWLQIVADVFNIKVLVSGAFESAALGAVMLGAEAFGMEANFENKILATYHPDNNRHRIYKRCFEKFQRIYELLQCEMTNET